MIFKFDPESAAGNGDFAELTGAIEDYLESQSVPMAVSTQFMIAFDELISNVLNYGEGETDDCGQSESAPELVVQINVENGRVLAEVADNGSPFDPLSLPEPDTTASVEERELGGLGVHIVRNVMDEISYSRDSGWNRLRFSKTFTVE